MRVAREHEAVMQQVLVTTVKGEVEHHPRAGRLVDAAFHERVRGYATDQLAVGTHRIGIRDDRSQVDRLADFGFHAYSGAVLVEDAADAGDVKVVKLTAKAVADPKGDGPDGKGNTIDDTWGFWFQLIHAPRYRRLDIATATMPARNSPTAPSTTPFPVIRPE